MRKVHVANGDMEPMNQNQQQQQPLAEEDEESSSGSSYDSEEDGDYDSEDDSYDDDDDDDDDDEDDAEMNQDEYISGEDEFQEQEDGQGENQDEVKEEDIFTKLKRIGSEKYKGEIGVYQDYQAYLGNDFEPEVLREKVEGLVEELVELNKEDKKDTHLQDALSYCNGYLIAVEKHPDIYSKRGDINLKMKNFIEALHDVNSANQMDQTIPSAKSCKVHYVISKSLMRLSNDV